MSDPRLGWPSEWLAFELLRRRDDYQRTWDAVPDHLRPESLFTQPHATPFGLQYMLDPHKDAEAHGHVPWRPGSGPIPVDVVRAPIPPGSSSGVELRLASGEARFVALRFDLGRPIAPQLMEARALLLGMQRHAPRPSRGRSASDIVRACNVLDLRAEGATPRQIGQLLAERCHDPTDRAKKLLAAARQLSDDYLLVANGVAANGVKFRR